MQTVCFWKIGEIRQNYRLGRVMTESGPTALAYTRGVTGFHPTWQFVLTATNAAVRSIRAIGLVPARSAWGK
jgi:hypothetical protein